MTNGTAGGDAADDTSDVFTCTVVGDNAVGDNAVDPSANGAESFAVADGQPVLLEMVARSVKALPVGCRGGGCGVCRVEVVSGTYDTLKMSKRHVDDDDRAAGYALSCRLIARSDLVVRGSPGPNVVRVPR